MPHSVHNTPPTSTPPPVLTSDPTSPLTLLAQHSKLPLAQRFWNCNIDPSNYTDSCPDYLLNQSAKNIRILASPNSSFTPTSWTECKAIVADNRIGDFQRSPVELRRYVKYIHELKREYGSVLEFVQRERLGWESTTPSGKGLFEDESDFKVLFNDWPYGLEDGVVHLVVWTKFLLDEDERTGDLTEEARGVIEGFVRERFCEKGGVDRGDLVWFKNWRSLKSVHALEHFHVMMWRPGKEFVREVTGGDRAVSEIVA